MRRNRFYIILEIVLDRKLGCIHHKTNIYIYTVCLTEMYLPVLNDG